LDQFRSTSPVSFPSVGCIFTDVLTNLEIAELLAREAEHAKQLVQRALRRASRRAFLWPEEAADVYRRNEPLTQLSGIGPYLQKVLRKPPESPDMPEIRRDFLTMACAKSLRKKRPKPFEAVQGDLQMHTTWSDGSASIQEMAEAAMERHYSYIAITDHGKGLKIAGGIDEEQVNRQGEEIRQFNDSMEKRGLRVLRSIELNLSPTGDGDMDESCLKSLDLVLGCFHSALSGQEDQTERYLAALRNPQVHILGHPRGRVYNFRLGLGADWARVSAVAAQLDKGVEVDCYPDRQDLNVDLLRLAKQAGCRISLGTDSHGPSQLAFMDLGVAAISMARIDRRQVLNFLSANELLSWTASLRARTT
jgi:histidinol phosphatase-like PHP family hydrolase